MKEQVGSSPDQIADKGGAPPDTEVAGADPGKVIRAALLSAMVAYSSAGAPATKAEAAPKAAMTTIAMTADLPIAREVVTFTAGTDTVPGTLVHPIRPGRYAGIVIMAGSGPTDRDWNSRLLPGKNGSARLLAEALAKRGAVVLRFDKAGVGGNRTPIESGVTFDVYRDEGRAALALLRARPDVARGKLYVAGHSEGGIHASRVALAEGNQIAGLVLLSASGRSMKDLLLAQLESQMRAAMPAQADSELASLRAAFDDFLAGEDVDPTKVTSIPAVQHLVAAIVAPQTAALSRGLFGFDPAVAVGQVTVPVFVYNGEHDVQVDAQVDAKNLEHARAGKPVVVFLAPEADHVLKHEPRPISELRKDLAGVQNGYNAESRTLDDATLAAIVGWLAKH